jgi:signal transduction histidine kinase
MKLIQKYNRMILPAMALLFIASVICSYYLIRHALQNELDKGLLRTKSRIEQYVAAHGALPPILSFDDQHIEFEKVQAAGGDSGLSSSTQFIPEQYENHRSRKLIFTISAGGNVYRATIIQPLEGIKHLTRVVAIIAMATVFLTLVLLLLINRNMFSRIWRPFYSALDAMGSFKVHNSQVPAFPTTSIEEFNLINQHFRQSAENAIRDYKILKEFTENASHEIQTPLAIIRAKLDLMIQQENLSEVQVGLLQSIYASITKLTKLQQSLSLLTKMENGQFHPNSQIALDHEIRSKVDQFQELWQNKRIHYSVQLSESVIHANKELLDILLNNLIGNATRHNVQDGSIEISLDRRSLRVSNTGAQEPLDPDRLFRRFYKQSPQSDNNGLGLSIIKAICEASAANIFYQYDRGWHRFSLSW